MAASETLRPFVERHGDDLDADDAFTVEVMRRHGVPPRRPARFRRWGAHTVVDRVLDDGTASSWPDGPPPSARAAAEKIHGLVSERPRSAHELAAAYGAIGL